MRSRFMLALRRVGEAEVKVVEDVVRIFLDRLSEQRDGLLDEIILVVRDVARHACQLTSLLQTHAGALLFGQVFPKLSCSQ